MRFLVLPVILLAATAHAAAKPRFAPSTGESARYRCADGRAIEVLYSRGDIAVINVADSPLELARIEGEAGEAYRGAGWRWRVAAPREGTLTRDGAADVKCRVG